MTQKQIAAKSLKEANELFEQLGIKEVVEKALDSGVIPTYHCLGKTVIEKNLRRYFKETPKEFDDAGILFIANYDEFAQKRCEKVIEENAKCVFAQKLYELKLFFTKSSEGKKALKEFLEDLDGQVILWDIIEELYKDLDKHVYTEYVHQIEDAIAESGENFNLSILYKGEYKEKEVIFPKIMPALTVRTKSEII